MSKKKTIFISDIHMGAGHGWDWFSIDKEGPYLENFFEYVADRQSTDDDIKELVLLGDIFDLWVCPHNEEPHTFDHIREAQYRVIEKIKETAQKVPVLYINGNHDFRVTENDIKKTFGDTVKHIGNVYRRANIHAEHGHRYALFNRPDPKNGGPSALPLGYYISRLHASLGENRKAKANLIFQSIEELFEMMGPEKLPESVLDAVKEAVEKTHSIQVESFMMGQFGIDQPYSDVKDRYQDLFDDWLKAKGYWYTTQMIMSEVNRLGTVADSLCRDGVDIVIFGHSHDTKMDKDSLFVKDRIYANCGYWCGFGEKENIDDNAHFVETDGQKVSLYRFNNGDVKEVVSRKL